MTPYMFFGVGKQEFPFIESNVSFFVATQVDFWYVGFCALDSLDQFLQPQVSSADFVVQEQHFPNPYEESFRCFP